jgi:hypothetical protein
MRTAETSTIPRLLSGGFALEDGPARLGWLRDSSDALAEPQELRRRMTSDGYLLIRGLLDVEMVRSARASVLSGLAEKGKLMPGSEPAEALANPSNPPGFHPEIANPNAALSKLLYTGAMMQFFEQFLGAPVRHFDYTWLRTVAPGTGTASHCDVVYMGRGTRNLYTAWTPLGDVDLALGGLMILEGSNRNERLKSTYGQHDVDTHCLNRQRRTPWRHNGHLSKNPNRIRQSVGGRWLTTEYRTGDVLVFSCYTVHASLDNSTPYVRLSSDSRYQLAAEPADERWVGQNPLAHSKSGKRGRIC